MLRWVRSMSLTFVLAALLLTGSASSASSQNSDALAGENPIAAAYPEVRIRKLHLVRPDLIPYPIAYEVIC